MNWRWLASLLVIIDLYYYCGRSHELYIKKASPHLADQSMSLASLISPGTTKARLLHYFPPSEPTTDGGGPIDSWCGFHLDHSLLTGLCSVYPSLACPLAHLIFFFKNRPRISPTMTQGSPRCVLPPRQNPDCISRRAAEN